MTDKAGKQSDQIRDNLISELEHLYGDAFEEIMENVDLESMILDDEDASSAKRYNYAKKHGLSDATKTIAVYLVATNKRATDRINTEMKRVYKVNYTYKANIIKKATGVSIGTGKWSGVGAYTKRAYKELTGMQYVSNDVIKTLKEGIRKGEGFHKLERRVRKVTGYNKRRSQTITRTETTRMKNKSRYDAVLKSIDKGFEYEKVWRHSPRVKHPRDWHQDMDGESVPFEQPFSNGMMYPGEAGAPAEEVCNCHCYIEDKLISWR